jgi:hypothetical protein
LIGFTVIGVTGLRLLILGAKYPEELSFLEIFQDKDRSYKYPRITAIIGLMFVVDSLTYF